MTPNESLRLVLASPRFGARIPGATTRRSPPPYPREGRLAGNGNSAAATGDSRARRGLVGVSRASRPGRPRPGRGRKGSCACAPRRPRTRRPVVALEHPRHVQPGQQLVYVVAFVEFIADHVGDLGGSRAGSPACTATVTGGARRRVVVGPATRPRRTRLVRVLS